jgi:ABC-type antimicrobial peptide transport system permease subunit
VYPDRGGPVLAVGLRRLGFAVDGPLVVPDGEPVAAALRDAVRAADPEQPVEGLTTIGDIVSESTADRRFYAIATAAFASLALLLAVAGLFGVVSRSVTERRREFAIRSALGADSMRIMRLIVVHGLVPVAAGAIAGLAGAFLGSRLLTKFLFEVTPTDTLTYSVAGGVVVVVALAACLVPARRALRVPPMLVLKGE